MHIDWSEGDRRGPHTAAHTAIWLGCALLLAFAALFWPAPARAQSGLGTYLYWRSATEIDNNCHFLKAVERRALAEVVNTTRAETPEYQRWQSESLPDAEYEAFEAFTTRNAEEKATELGCTGDAAGYLLTARDYANRLIVQDIMLANHFHTLPEGELARQPLTEQQLQAMNAYLGFVSQVYADSYTRFEAEQRDMASRRLMAVMPGADLTGGAAGAPSISLLELSSAAARTVEAVHFEVVAETAGYRVWPEPRGSSMVDTLHVAGSTEPYAYVVSGPLRFRTDAGTLFGTLLDMAPAPRLWLMSYGDLATSPPTDAARIALLVPPPGHPVNWFDDGWRQGTTRFDARRLEADCLAAPCWELPDTARAALLGMTRFDQAELWLSLDSAEPAAESISGGRTPVMPALLQDIEAVRTGQ